MLSKLFAEFIREKQYLNGVSPKTIKYFGYVFSRWNPLIDQFPDKQNIKEFVITLSESGISYFTINSYIRGMNSFLTWLYENEHTPDHLKIKKIKEPKRGLKIYSESELKKILSFRPKTFADHRLYTMICLMIDTGVRIDECLTLRRKEIDLENLLIKVVGKGNKERIVPISLECRKHLFKFLRSHESDYAFPARHGCKVDYKTCLDQLKRTFAPLKVGFHKFRHTFASCYVRDGGNVFYLQRVLGHTDLQTTKIYVADQVEDLKLVHKKTSLLNRLK
ncbi:MAG TPA: tyrosine-type recombinase/integrase [Pyrinomonadaceae bacterium]|jgi:integrase